MAGAPICGVGALFAHTGRSVALAYYSLRLRRWLSSSSSSSLCQLLQRSHRTSRGNLANGEEIFQEQEAIKFVNWRSSVSRVVQSCSLGRRRVCRSKLACLNWIKANRKRADLAG